MIVDSMMTASFCFSAEPGVSHPHIVVSNNFPMVVSSVARQISVQQVISGEIQSTTLSLVLLRQEKLSGSLLYTFIK